MGKVFLLYKADIADLSIFVYCLYFSLSQATRLKKEQEALLLQQWELEKIEEERMKAQERRKKSEMG